MDARYHLLIGDDMLYMGYIYGYIYIIITINSIFHTADVPIFSRSLAPYLADPDARVRLAVVEAAVTEKNPAKRVRFA